MHSNLISLANVDTRNSSIKTTKIKCIAGNLLAFIGSFRGPLKPVEHHSSIVLRSLRRALNWTSIMPRGASLSDSQCNFFKSGIDSVP